MKDANNVMPSSSVGLEDMLSRMVMGAIEEHDRKYYIQEHALASLYAGGVHVLPSIIPLIFHKRIRLHVVTVI